MYTSLIWTPRYNYYRQPCLYRLLTTTDFSQVPSTQYYGCLSNTDTTQGPPLYFKHLATVNYHEWVSLMVRVCAIRSFSQSQVTSVICFCQGLSCCPYYKSVSSNSKGFLPLPVSIAIFTLAPDLSFACLGVLGLGKNMGEFAILTAPCYGNNCTNAHSRWMLNVDVPHVCQKWFHLKRIL